jgi:hypothetical protein
MTAEMERFWLAQRGNWQLAANRDSHKWQGRPELDLGVGPSKWGVDCEGPSTVGQGNSIRTKRRITKDNKAGDIAGAQSGNTQELPARRFPGHAEDQTKLGHSGLGMETLVVPPQGVCPLHRLGLTITDTTLGSHQDTDQAWMEGRVSGSGFREAVGIEDAHDENETDKQRWARLMLKENGEWKCMGCGGRVFSDRCTLQRHCRSAVHGKQRDWRKCPFCPNLYQRQSGVNRHIKLKHPGERGEEGGISRG